MDAVTKRRISLFIFSFIFWTSLYGCAMAPAPILEASGDANLAELLESIRVKERLPALAAAVIIDNKIHAAAAVGTRKFGSENWVAVDDSFLIASCSKAFTAALAAILVEDGLLAWNTTLRDAYPELDMRKEYENITLIQLLSHRAGLPEWIGSYTSKNADEQFYGKWWKDNRTPKVMRSRYFEETVKEELADSPGQSIYYSNSGYLMAGAMLEKMAGKSYEQLMIEEIFKPLGLHTAGFGMPITLSSAYQPFGHKDTGSTPTPITRDFPVWMAPTAVIHISIQDWAKFIRVHLTPEINGRTMLRADTVKRLHTPPNNAKWREDAEENSYGVPSLNYALGWYTLDMDGKKGLLWHPGGNTGFIAQVFIDPSGNNAVLAVTNVRTEHKHLFKAMSGIEAYYADIVDLPGMR